MSGDAADLRAVLKRIDGGPYPGYRDLRGGWSLGAVELSIDHVQGDPFAAPSSVRLRVACGITNLSDPDDKRAAEDWLLRRVVHAVDAGLPAGEGSGRSGQVSVLRPGPEVVWRSALRLSADGTAEIRLRVGLPANGRRVLGRAAHTLLTQTLPGVALTLGDSADAPSLARHRNSVRTQAQLRRALGAAGLVAFVADGSVLPRVSGVGSSPLPSAVPTKAPDSLAVVLPSISGDVRGLGIRPGVSLLTGGGFHGKSTVLQALRSGATDFVPGDGRERVVAVPTTASIKAEEGRSVRGVDISAFVTALPGQQRPACFSTDNASGSTSQAASLVEALEAGATLLLLDEDTTATNLLFRDPRMAALVKHEPIVPLISHLQPLARSGVSTVLVAGGVGETLAVADWTIGVEEFCLQDWTAQARGIAGSAPTAAPDWATPAARVPAGPVRPSGKGRVRARDAHRVEFGQEELDLRFVEGIRDASHAASIGHALRVLGASADGTRSVAELLDGLEDRLEEAGTDTLSARPNVPDGTLVRPSRIEVAAALARLRSLRVTTP